MERGYEIEGRRGGRETYSEGSGSKKHSVGEGTSKQRGKNERMLFCRSVSMSDGAMSSDNQSNRFESR